MTNFQKNLIWWWSERVIRGVIQVLYSVLSHLTFPGLTESIVAAAASRIGKTVLHLDDHDFYGGFWASFNMDALQAYGQKCIDSNDTLEPVLESQELKLLPGKCLISNVEMNWKIPESVEDESETWTRAKIKQKMRHFNIDLSPTPLFSNGAMVKLLISSNICRYAEFRAVDRIATVFSGQIKTVPCSRSDVFNTNEVNVVEKRILMKLLESCMEFKDGNEEYESYKSKTFAGFLESKKVPTKVRHFLIEALSMSGEDTGFEEGVKNLNKFVDSLGRYGNTPFLFPMYGCGEIPQCFCRLCAVFGGIYCLQKRIKQLTKCEDGLTVLLDSNTEFKSKNVLFGSETIKVDSLETKKTSNLVRGIFIVDKSIEDSNVQPKGGGVEYLRLRHDKSEAHVFQLSHYSGCCPNDLYILHFTVKTDDFTSSCRDILAPFTDKIFNQTNETEDSASKVLFEMFFAIPDLSNQYDILEKVNICGGPKFSLDYDQSIAEAKEMFLKLFPGEDFLPRAPEPEEIIIEGYDETANDKETVDKQTDDLAAAEIDEEKIPESISSQEQEELP